MCIPDVRRAVHQGFSLREGVLVKASAVSLRAMPQTKGTHRHNGHRVDNTHILGGARHDTQPHVVTHLLIHVMVVAPASLLIAIIICVSSSWCVHMCVTVWVHFGSILGPFWVHFGSILGPFCL